MPERVLLLDNTLHPRLFILAKRWSRLLGSAYVDVVHAPTMRVLPDLTAYTHLVVAGSEASILQWAPWMEREAEAVREGAALGLRMLGSCFGHQMLVASLSGVQYLRRSPHPEVGWIAVEIIGEDELLLGVPNPWTVFSFHLDEVAAPPPSPWRILARSGDCPTQILRFGDAPVWGIQAHPEISRRAAEVATRSYLLLARRRGGAPRRPLRRPAAGDQAFLTLVDRFLGDGARSG